MTCVSQLRAGPEWDDGRLVNDKYGHKSNLLIKEFSTIPQREALNTTCRLYLSIFYIILPYLKPVSFKLLVFQLLLSYSYFFISVTVTNQLQLLVFQLFSVTVARKLGQLEANFIKISNNNG